MLAASFKTITEVFVMKLIKLLSMGAVVLTFTGCASIFGDNNRTVKVSSYPQGAGIYVDNKQYGVTPATVTLPNNIYGGKTVTFKKAGYAEQTQAINTKFQPVALLDILLWPTLIVDGVAGNLVKVDPADTAVNAKLIRA
jgi:hypothetical protein